MTAREPTGVGSRPREQSAPVAAVSGLTGIITLVGVLNGVVLSRLLDLEPVDAASLTVASGVAMVMVAEGAPFVAGRARERFAPDLRRIATKLLGLGCLFTLIAAAWLTFPYYNRIGAPLFGEIVAWIYVLAPLALAYVVLTDATDPIPVDGCHALGAAILGQSADRDALLTFLRGWLVKLFFLPLMFNFLTDYFVWMRELPAWTAILLADNWVEWPIRFMYLVDVSVAAVGYLATFRLCGWHVRDVEATTGGWVVCVICYPPLNPLLMGSFLTYKSDIDWADLVGPHTAPGIVIGVTLIALQACYVGATISFGPRFSNLTHRGIITRGPYRYSKHPAYLSKNILWWIGAMPFIPTAGVAEALRRCACLLCINLIYFLRAKAEERMLSADPDYRAYAAEVNRNGILARGRGLLQRLRDR
jgi:protein-S-isoprenylcysteine O-methyltransferase Ste14